MAKRKVGSSSKLGGKIIAGVLALAIVGGGVCCIGYASRDDSGKWFGNSHISSWHWSDKDKEEAEKSGGAIFNGVTGEKFDANTTYAMPTSIVMLSSVDPVYKAGPSVTIEASHSLALNNVEVTWKATYPSGADASDVVKITPDGLKATIQYVKSFDKQLTLTCSTSDGVYSAPCTIDCIKRIETTGNTYACFSDFGDTCDFGFAYQEGVGTVSADLTAVSATFNITDEFKALVKSFLKFDVEITSHTEYFNQKMYIGDDGAEAFAETCGENEVTYDMFIKDWDNFDEAHQTAIKYAWWQAYLKDFKDNGNRPHNSMLIDFEVNLTYHDYVVTNYQETDAIGIAANFISGSDGESINPNLSLNYSGAVV